MRTGKEHERDEPEAEHDLVDEEEDDSMFQA